MAAELLVTIARVLSSAGVYVIVSFRKERLLRKLLECEELPFEPLEHVELPATTGDSASFCRVRKRVGAATEIYLAALRANIDHVTDWWYQEQSPLLTRERREEVCAAWMKCARAAAHATGGAEELALPLRTAFEVLLTAEERTELSLDYFLADLSAFCSRALGGDGTVPSVLTLHQGLEFLELAS